MSYVIACGDEGVQINQGTRLAFAGAGFRLPGFSAAVAAMKQLFGPEIAIVASEENDWCKQVLGLHEWDQVNASMEQHIEALADRDALHYAGAITFSDPRQLAFEIKGHMVRPHNVHIANKICFTLGGGEQKYNLGCYVISADWAATAGEAVAKEVLAPQIAFYQKLAGKPLGIVYEEQGMLAEELVAQNKAIVEKCLENHE